MASCYHETKNSTNFVQPQVSVAHWEEACPSENVRRGAFHGSRKPCEPPSPCGESGLQRPLGRIRHEITCVCSDSHSPRGADGRSLCLPGRIPALYQSRDDEKASHFQEQGRRGLHPSAGARPPSWSELCSLPGQGAPPDSHANIPDPQDQTSYGDPLPQTIFPDRSSPCPISLSDGEPQSSSPKGKGAVFAPHPSHGPGHLRPSGGPCGSRKGSHEGAMEAFTVTPWHLSP